MNLLTVDNLKQAYELGNTSPRNLMENIIERSKELSDYNLWITAPSWELVEPYLQALEAMDSLEKERKPLWGIPFAVKDNIDLAGVPTTAACPAYSYTPAKSATVVDRLVEAGAIPVGKTNLDQFATGLVGTRSPYGECKNAFRPELISGGSSSGSAVAVALGLACFALGTDTAGSGRVPAALNNIVGFKPPLGSWSTSGVVPACASLDCVTVFANNLQDAMAINSCAKGFDASCCWSREIQSSAATQKATTIYVPEELPKFYGQWANEYQQAWLGFLENLETLAGYAKAEIKPLNTSYYSEIASILYDGPWVAERWSDLGDFVADHPNDIFPVTRIILESGNRTDILAADAFAAMHKITEARHRSHQQLTNAVLIMPTCGGTFTRAEVSAEPIKTNSLMGLYTNHCNLCDMAAMAIPAGWAEENLPFGVTLFTNHDQEQLLFDLAKHIEEAQL